MSPFGMQPTLKTLPVSGGYVSRLTTDPQGLGPDEFAREVEDFRRHQASRAVIEQAKGMLAAYYGVSPEDAFGVLRRWSMGTNTKLNVICTILVAAASQPSEDPFGGLEAAIRQFQSATQPVTGDESE